RKYFSKYEPLEYLDLASCVKEAFRVARQIQGVAGSTRSEKNTRSGLEEVALRPDLVFFSDPVLRGTRGCSSVPVVILFSPGAASFEKFLHEFDRGEQFNALVKKYHI
ncbi:MAG: hypothetical protein Q7S52_02120, partial [bacterium]|nr:hypothetical protein [bacterium]